ncbi:MAG: AAA family ATPase [Verrucomicrobiales bacterium]|nr:AAA family ATPase [Verrucomicrobiales bacterium]
MNSPPAAPSFAGKCPHPPPTFHLPSWAADLAALYESHAASQFILHGNVNDLLPIPANGGTRLGTLDDFLQESLLASFDVILTYDLGNGLRVTKGQKPFSTWPSAPQGQPLPRIPREAIDLMTHYIRYASNVRRMKGETTRIAFILRDAHLTMPALPSGLSYDLNAVALLVKGWSSESLLNEHPFASFLVSENLNDLHPLVARNPRSSTVKVPLPAPAELQAVFTTLLPLHPTALGNYRDRLEQPAGQLAGATLVSISALLKAREHRKQAIQDDDLARLKKELVEKDCQDLIEFIEPTRTLEDVHGMEGVKAWLREDFQLWRKNQLEAMPMGYLLCGPVGTGKTYLVECLAGEAGVPVVKFKNFRDRWVGSTEGNLEKIFRLLGALGRCFVFIDEADQALGKRNVEGDSGVGGRIYSMMAKEMSDTSKRGKVIWILASSRPDLIEIDLKRPGRIDMKIPLFPTSTPEEGFKLLQALCKKKKAPITAETFEKLKPVIPNWITPGAAEALAVKVFRLQQTRGISAEDALLDALDDYQPPVPVHVMEEQIGLAVQEASDLSFVPESFRKFGTAAS